MSGGTRRFVHNGRVIDLDDKTTWAFNSDVQGRDAKDIVLSDQQCAVIASVLDQARARRAAAAVRVRDLAG